MNTLLRDQLDKATEANQILVKDVDRLSQELRRARDEMEAKESEWREEEQVRYSEYTTIIDF